MKASYLRVLLLLSLAGASAAGTLGAGAPGPPEETRFIVLNGMRFRPGVEPLPSFAPELAGWQESGQRYLLVRFDGPLDADRIEAAERAGAAVLDTLSHYTLLVGAGPGTVGPLRSVEGVVWTGPWTPGMKAAPSLLAEAHAAAPTPEEPFVLVAYPHRDRRAAEVLDELADAVPVPAAARWATAFPEADGTGAVQLELTGPADVARILLDLARQPAVFSVHRGGRPEQHNSWNRAVVQGGVPPTVFGQTATVSYLGLPWTEMPQPGASPQAGDTTGVAMYPIHARGLLGQGQCVVVQDSGLVNLDFFQPYDACSTSTSCISPQWDRKTVCHYRANSSATCGDDAQCDFHGTHVAGTAAGDRFDHGDGGYDFGDGIAPQAKIVFQDYASVSATNDCTLDVASLTNLRTSYLNGTDGSGDPWECRVHNNSWGLPLAPSYNGSSLTMDQFVWDAETASGLQQDLLVVSSAGNSGPDPSTLSQPATAKNVLTVGAVDPGYIGGVNQQSFSSNGPTTDGSGRIKPDVATTGCAFSACGANDADSCVGMGGFTAWKGTNLLCGTSMAAPTASGAAMLVRQYLREGWYPCGKPGCASPAYTAPSAALVKALLINGTDAHAGAHLGDGTPIEDDPVPNNRVGFGWLNLENSLYFEGDRLQVKILAQRSSRSGLPGLGVETGETQSYDLPVTGAEPLRLTLTWTDPQGTTVGNALVNDLDLRAVAPDGTPYRGNQWSAPTGGPRRNSRPNPPFRDTTNNVETIHVPDPQPGTWTIEVIGTNVPGRAGRCDAPCSQGYVLVASGRFFDDTAAALHGYLATTEYGVSGGCDGDVFLDNGERATLSVTFRNDGAKTAPFPKIDLSVAPDSDLPASGVDLLQSVWTGFSLAEGQEVTRNFDVRFLEQPGSFHGRYLKLKVDYTWDLSRTSSEYLSIPLQASPVSTPMLAEDFEGVSTGDTPAQWTPEFATYSCLTSTCDWTTFSGYMAGGPPGVMTYDSGTPRDTPNKELKFGAGDCVNAPPCCQFERLKSPDIFPFLNRMTDLTFYYRLDQPSAVVSAMTVDPDGELGGDFPGSYRGVRVYGSTGDLPWERYRADLRPLDRIRGTSFSLAFGGGSTVPAFDEQGSRLDDIHIASVGFDAVNARPGPPSTVAPLNGATGVSVRPTLQWSHTAANPGREYEVRVCSDPSCGIVVWSDGGLTGDQIQVEPALTSLAIYYWQVRADDNCNVGAWNNPRSFTTGQADFDVSYSAGTVAVLPGSLVMRSAGLTWLTGWDGDVTLSCSGLPADSTCSFAPNPALFDGTTQQNVEVTLDVGPGALPGTYFVKLEGLGTVDGAPRTRSANLELEVLPTGPGEALDLTLSLGAGGVLDLTWSGGGCNQDDFGVYAGNLETLHAGSYAHDLPLTCSTGGLTVHGVPADVQFASYGFDVDLEGWTETSLGCTSSLWVQTDRCTLPARAVAYFGTAACNYDTGSRVCGALDSPAIDLTATDHALLSFDYRLGTEQLIGYDIARVEVAEVGTSSWIVLADNQGGPGGLVDDGKWHRASLALPITGTGVQVRFSFDSVDGIENSYRGFMVDDVEVRNLPLNAYFLVTATNPVSEGSYGEGLLGAERPTSGAACRAASDLSCP
ncbi:MAG: S8 family serine peptidase [Acidobacteriota bacterium]|jgi:hypothetical protein